MPLELPDLKFYEAACGFLQLGMGLDADAELDKIDPTVFKPSIATRPATAILLAVLVRSRATQLA